MNEYTPSTAEVRDGWNAAVIEGAAPKGALVDSDWGDSTKTDAQFDRWLLAERARIWDEGRAALAEQERLQGADRFHPITRLNPYRTGGDA